MSDDQAEQCPNCGEARVSDSAQCVCGHVYVAAPQTFMAYQGASYTSGFAQAVGGPPSVADRIIPLKNPKALLAYYFGVFSIVPCFSPILGPAALIFGFLGLKALKLNPMLPGKGHAVFGIIMGGIMTLLSIAIGGLIIYAIATKPRL